MLDKNYYNERKNIIEKNAMVERNLASMKKITGTELEIALNEIDNAAAKKRIELDSKVIEQVQKMLEDKFIAYQNSHKTLLEENKAFNDKAMYIELDRLNNEQKEAEKIIEQKYKDGKLNKIQFDNEMLALADTYGKDEKAIIDKYNTDQIAADKQLQDLRLSVAIDGSQEQLNLKIQANRAQLDEDIKHTKATILNEVQQAEAIKLLKEKSNQDILEMQLNNIKDQVGRAGMAVTKIQDLYAADEDLKLHNLEVATQEEKNKQSENFESLVKENQDRDNQEIVNLKDKYKKGLIDKEDYENNLKSLQDKANKSSKTTKEQFDASIKKIDEKAAKDAKKIGAENAETAKVLAVANTIINTIEGALAAFTGLLKLDPTGITGTIVATAVAATGALAVSKILATPIPDSGGGGESAGSSGSLSAPSAGGGGIKQTNVNEGIVSRSSNISSLDAKIPTPMQPVLIIDDVTARQNKDKINNDIATI